VGFSGNDLLSIFKGCAAVRRPGHFEDAGGSMDMPNAQALTKGTPRLQIFNEAIYYNPKSSTVRRRQPA
jgi:hypothetical protein